MRSTIVGANGNLANVTPDGKLEVDTTVSVDTLTISEVAVKDGASTNKLKVNADGSIDVKHTGSIVAEQKTQADAVAGVVTFSANISAIEIYNKSAVSGVFSVNGFAITVPAESAWSGGIGGVAGATVTVTGATSYEIRRLT